tara:strand:- start:632 stop:1513 length:882 start_codon:yes stop_codon:yes gene_type:complete
MYYISDLLIPLLIFIILISIYFFRKKQGKNDNIIYYLTFIFYAFFWNMPAILQIILSPVFALIIVYFIRFKISTIQKNYLSYALLAHVVFFAFLMFTSINDEIRFDDVKNIRYQQVILKLKDIRDSQIAHRSVKGYFQNNWDSLVRFIETDSFTITQRKDSSILDKEMTKRYGGVKTYKDIIIIDTLGFIQVKDSLFGFDNRYEQMFYVPNAKDPKTKFELNAGFLNQNGIDIPVFEAKISKKVILHDLSINLVLKENQVQSVDGVNGRSLKIGSMNEVNTNGNWPKNYSKGN